MNIYVGIGNLTKAVDLRYTQSNLAIARFTLAINRQKTKEGKQECDFINCVAYGKTAELLSKHLDKGSKISVEGHIQTGLYEKDGKKIYTTDVAVERVQFLDRKKKDDLENKTDSEIIASVVNEEQYQLPF